MALAGVGGGCVRTVRPTPSPAVLEARAPRPPPPPCTAFEGIGTVDAPFPYAAFALTDEVEGALTRVVSWQACHPDGAVVLVGVVEPHYRRPDVETQLLTQRIGAVSAWLRERGVAPVDEATATAGSGPVLRVRVMGRGW